MIADDIGNGYLQDHVYGSNLIGRDPLIHRLNSIFDHVFRRTAASDTYIYLPLNDQ